jgi:pimeloyl-ACP methyl ester carboxylesterase
MAVQDIIRRCGERRDVAIHLRAPENRTATRLPATTDIENMHPSYHTSSNGYRIAYRHQEGEGMGVIFCCGYRSDMDSTKATALAGWCGERNIPFTCFDYFAHGASDGELIDYTIGHALNDTLEILDTVAAKEVVLVGSSMGGWVGMLAAMQRPLQVKAMLGVAAAPDFTERLMYKKLPPELRKQLEEEGVIYLYSEMSDSDYPVPLNFITEARRHLLLEHPIPLSIPMHLLQGQLDDSVPWDTALAIAEKVIGDEVTVTLVKDGDHRLNRPQDLRGMLNALERLRGE